MPMIISELGDSLYSITDTYFVSGLGKAALAAVAAGSYVSRMFFVVVALFYSGSLVYVSQAYGAGRVGEARRAIGVAAAVGSLVGGATALLIHLVADTVIGFVAGPQPGIAGLAASYLRARSLGLSVAAAVYVLDSSLRAVGATRFSMIAMLSSVVLDMVLDPILIYGYWALPGLVLMGALGVVGVWLAMFIDVYLRGAVFLVAYRLFFHRFARRVV